MISHAGEAKRGIGSINSRSALITRCRMFVLVVGLTAMSLLQGAESASLHVTASAPWRSYADPLADPTGSPLLPAVFDALIVIERDGTLAPALAETWSNDSDKVWTFKLRPNVVFSDGSPVDAAAVAECLSMLIGTAGQVYAPYLYTSSIRSVRAISADEVEIATHDKDARLDRKLSNVSIFSVAALERLGRSEFSKSPVGSGPFTPESWSGDGTRVTLKSVPSSWRKSRQLERVEIAVIPDATARLQSILSNGTDISNNLDPDLIPTIEGAGFDVSIRPGPIVLAMALRTNDGAAAPLRARRVRQALNLAINRKNISEFLLHGSMGPATQLATPEALGYDSSIDQYDYDPDRAKKLLAEAGYPEGFGLTGTVMTGQFPGDTLIYQQVVQDLNAIGVRVVLGTLPVIEFIRRRTANTWDGVDVISTLLSHYRLGDISGAVELLTCGDHRSTFCDPELDEMLQRSHREMKAAAREELLQSINARIQHLAPVIMISQYSAVDALSKRIVKFPDFPAGKLRFEQIEVVED